jgi:hypothetical protein
MHSTLGQPTPLAEGNGPLLSNTYQLYPGFLYAQAASLAVCRGDFEPDGDVDGADLAQLLKTIANDGSAPFSIGDFVGNFGKSNCK